MVQSGDLNEPDILRILRLRIVFLVKQLAVLNADDLILLSVDQ
jgi:hypothetical protein